MFNFCRPYTLDLFIWTDLEAFYIRFTGLLIAMRIYRCLFNSIGLQVYQHPYIRFDLYGKIYVTRFIALDMVCISGLEIMFKPSEIYKL